MKLAGVNLKHFLHTSAAKVRRRPGSGQQLAGATTGSSPHRSKVSLTVVIGGNLGDCNALPAQALPMHVGQTQPLYGTEAGEASLLDLAPNNGLLVWSTRDSFGERTVQREADVKDAVLACKVVPTPPYQSANMVGSRKALISRRPSTVKSA